MRSSVFKENSVAFMLLQILFCSFILAYPRPLIIGPCNSNEPCTKIEKSHPKQLSSQKRLRSPHKNHVGHRSKRKLNRISNPMAGIRRDAKKGKWWKGAQQNLKKIKRRQVKGCQRKMCWLRDKMWNKKKEGGKNKGKKNEVKTNINLNKNSRDRGWKQRTKNWEKIKERKMS